MKKYILLIGIIVLILSCANSRTKESSAIAVVRINQLGYLPESIKVAVFGAKGHKISNISDQRGCL